MKVTYFENKHRLILDLLRETHDEVLSMDGIFKNMAGKLNRDLLYLENLLDRMLSIGLETEAKTYVSKLQSTIYEVGFISALASFAGEKKVGANLAKIEDILK